VRALVGDALAQIVQSIASVVAGLVIAFYASWRMAFIILALVPLLAVNGYVQQRFAEGFSADAKVCSSTNDSFFYELFIKSELGCRKCMRTQAK